MNAAAEELANHLSCPVTTTCFCWIVKRRDGHVLGFTDHDLDIDIEGVLCTATTGFSASEISVQLGLGVDNQELEGAFCSQNISKEDLLAGIYDNSRIEVWIVNWADVSQRLHQNTFIMGEITRQEHYFRAELRGLSSLLDKRNGRVFSRRCDAILGDERCKVDVDAPQHKVESRILSIMDQRRFRGLNIDNFDRSWFSGGQVVWLSGNNVGTTSELSISSVSQDGQLSLWQRPPHEIQIGDQFNVIAGCDKTFATCKSKFQNGTNFQGCPHMPGAEFALGYASGNAIHDGTALVE